MTPRRRRPVAVVGASVLAAVALVGIGRGLFGPVEESPPAFAGPAGTAEAASRFLDAWNRSLMTSWSIEETIERTTRTGRRLTFGVHRAQRPPDHLQIGLGSVDARLGGRNIACATTSNGQLSCRAVDAGPTYEDDVRNQLATLRPYVTGAVPLYAVAQVGGCFQLTLRLPGFPVPPYGRTAVFCFDPLTGAPAGSVVIRDEGTDRTTIAESHAPATNADLTLPAAEQITAGAPSA